MSEEKVVKVSLYQRILESGKEALKNINEPITRKRDKRAFKSAYDNALEKRDKAIQDRSALYEKIGEYADNVEKIVKTRGEQRQAELTMEFLKSEYLEVFGEDMPDNE